MAIDPGAYVPSNIKLDVAPGILGPDSGVYSGSLSAQGNMVATQLNPGDFMSEPIGIDNVIFLPYHVGYFRTYWENPKLTTFGCDTSIPAITGVVPSVYANNAPAFGDMQGSLVYYIDLAMARLTGSNSFNLPHFINSLNQTIGWVSVSNSYLAALKNAEQHNLAYYGAASYRDLITLGFDKYQTPAIVAAIKNQGKMVTAIPDGNFGTPNAVAKILLANGLGGVGNLYAKMAQANVNFDDIGNTTYTPVITEILRSITDQADLKTIQEVIGSSVPNLLSPLGYCSIENSSGLVNNSTFPDMAALGRDIYTKAPNLILTTGAQLATLIENIQSEVTANVEALSSTTGALSQTVINQLRDKLPIAPGNNPVSVLNVLGMASGYLMDYMNEVNIGLARLYATSYGPQIRSILEEISRVNAQVPLTLAELQGAGSDPNYWTNQQSQNIAQYRTLLATIVNDTTGDIPVIVKQINDNYFRVCENLHAEYVNYNRAKMTMGEYSDTSLLLAFATSIPSLGEDLQNLGTDLLLYGMSQPNPAGDAVRALLGQSKNAALFNFSGIRISGIL